MTPTEAITALEKALKEVRKWHKMKSPTADGRLDLPRAQRDSLRDFSDACSPLAIRTLLDAHAGALRDTVTLHSALARLETAVDWHLGRSGFTQSVRLKGVEHSANVRKELYAAHDAARAALATNTKAQP